MSDRFGMTDNYLIHSAKGTSWKNHKYIKKVGNKYYYKDEKGELVEGDPSDNGDILTETKESTTSSSKSKKSKKSTETDRIKTLANKVMAGKLGQNQLRKATSSKDYIKVMNTINSKFKKPSSSGSSSKSKEKEKKTSEKKTSEKKTSEKKTSEKKTTEKSNNIEKDKTNQITNQVVEIKNKVDTTPKTEEAKTETKSESTTSTENTVSENIKSAVKSVTTITDNDSIYATKNEDGTTTVTVDFEDGTTQTFTLAQTFDVISKTEKTKKQLTHSTFKGNGYLIHRIM